MLKIYDTANIAGHYLPALINGDYSGLDDMEENQLNDYLETLPAGVIFDCSSDYPEFARCAISGLMAECLEVNLWSDDNG